MEIITRDIQFQIERGKNKCTFYVEGSTSTSSKRIGTFDLKNSISNDYIHSITITIRKKLNEDKTLTRYLHRIVLITTLGDVFVFDSLDALKKHLTDFFEKYPNLIEFDYDYKI